VDQVALAPAGHEGRQKWSDLYVGRTDPATIEAIRAAHTDGLRRPSICPAPPAVPAIPAAARWRSGCASATAGGPDAGRCSSQDFVELVTGGPPEEFNELMGRVAQEAPGRARARRRCSSSPPRMSSG
jgi:hypothetical protein